MTLTAFEYYPRGAAISRIQFNPAVIPIDKQLEMYIYFCVSIHFILNSFYNTALSDKKKYRYLICNFKFVMRTD